MFLKVSHWKKILRFGHKRKLCLRFIGLYKIIERLGLVAYHLTLPSELEKIYNVFHVSMLRRYRSDPSHVIFPVNFEILLDMYYSEKPVKILAQEVKELRNKSIGLVKVLWHHHGIEETTCKPKEVMTLQYPHLFSGKIFEDENSLRGESCNSLISNAIRNGGFRTSTPTRELV
ncbi:receptor-like protein kinase [Gossypium australe]|uniref:Receptor-like protein kinase n=1 Tax=Gossypium australe TaxID=47621 RepID=A0A5B6WQZ0_9ROSI|nr:receptor-like protein kinase [Gossypium australe]